MDDNTSINPLILAPLAQEVRPVNDNTSIDPRTPPPKRKPGDKN